jgi:tRNA 5-methylaminomethyl-2-thiouridine biosynthesis bifunctional protein
MAGLHRIELSSGVRLHLIFGDPAHLLSRLAVRADALILSDGGVLARVPTNRRRMAARLTAACRHGARLGASALPAGWQEIVLAAGFAPADASAGRRQPAPDVAGYFEARFERLAATRQAVAPAGDAINGDVMIIGAGLAGSAIASALQASGQTATLIDPHGQGASRWPQHQAAVAAHVHLAVDDNPLARLSRAALSLCGSQVGVLRRPGRLVLDTGRDANHATRLLQYLPTAFARQVSRAEASDISGLPMVSSGIWLPDLPVRISEDQPAATPSNGSILTSRVASLALRDAHWMALDANGQVIAGARRVVLAGGPMPGLAPIEDCLRGVNPNALTVAGQSSRISVPRMRLNTVVSAGRYVVPLPDGDWLVGATYREPADLGSVGKDHTAVRDADNRANINALQQLFVSNAPFLRLGSHAITGHAGYRFMLPDRLPMIGPAPDLLAIMAQRDALARNDRLPLPVLPGVYVATGFGSRGLLWSALAASVITDLMNQRVPALESDLLAAISPDRFLRRSLRRKQLK